jgi:hypothetical protein
MIVECLDGCLFAFGFYNTGVNITDQFASSLAPIGTECIYATALLGTSNMAGFFEDVLLFTEFLESPREMFSSNPNCFRDSGLRQFGPPLPWIIPKRGVPQMQ